MTAVQNEERDKPCERCLMNQNKSMNQQFGDRLCTMQDETCGERRPLSSMSRGSNDYCNQDVFMNKTK